MWQKVSFSQWDGNLYKAERLMRWFQGAFVLSALYKLPVYILKKAFDGLYHYKIIIYSISYYCSSNIVFHIRDFYGNAQMADNSIQVFSIEGLRMTLKWQQL